MTQLKNKSQAILRMEKFLSNHFIYQSQIQFTANNVPKFFKLKIMFDKIFYVSLRVSSSSKVRSDTFSHSTIQSSIVNHSPKDFFGQSFIRTFSSFHPVRRYPVHRFAALAVFL